MAGNLILLALPAAERDWLASRAQEIRVQHRQLLHVAGERLAWHHFPLDCLVASYGVGANGVTAEYSMLGIEGFTGVSAVLGDARGIGDAFALVEGRCIRVSVATVREAFARGGSLPTLMLRYASLRVLHIAQTSLCAAHHAVDQRLARWLLQAFDRVPGPTLSLTHELVATALGVRREAVSLSVRALHIGGAIRAHRGVIELRDRSALEQKACECYKVLKAELRKLLTDFGATSSSNGSQAKYTDGALSSNRR